MKNTTNTKSTKEKRQAAKPYKVRLPGFVQDEEIGLGDVVKRATTYVGIKPCGGCNRRANTLNRWMVFSGKN